MSDPSEQRRQVRLPISQVIRVAATRGNKIETENSRMVDVSEGGLCFVGPRYLPPGTPVSIEVRDCRVNGEVRHCRLREYGSHIEFVTGVQVAEVAAGADTWAALRQSSR